MTPRYVATLHAVACVSEALEPYTLLSRAACCTMTFQFGLAKQAAPSNLSRASLAAFHEMVCSCAAHRTMRRCRR